MPQLEILITKTRIIVATFAHFPTKSRLNSIRHSQQCLCKTRLILTKKRLKTRNIRLHLNHLNQTKHLTNLNNAKKKKTNFDQPMEKQRDPKRPSSASIPPCTDTSETLIRLLQQKTQKITAKRGANPELHTSKLPLPSQISKFTNQHGI